MALSEAYELCADLEELAARAENLAGNPHLRTVDTPLAAVWLDRIARRATKSAAGLRRSLPEPAAADDTPEHVDPAGR